MRDVVKLDFDDFLDSADKALEAVDYLLASAEVYTDDPDEVRIGFGILFERIDEVVSAVDYLLSISSAADRVRDIHAVELLLDFHLDKVYGVLNQLNVIEYKISICGKWSSEAIKSR